MAASAFWRLQRLRHQRPPSPCSGPFPPSSSAASSACTAQQRLSCSRFSWWSTLLLRNAEALPPYQKIFYRRLAQPGRVLHGHSHASSMILRVQEITLERLL